MTQKPAKATKTKATKAEALEKGAPAAAESEARQEDRPEAEQKRRSERIFLVVVDDTPEMEVALRFACLRAKNSGGRVALLYVIVLEQVQNWMGIDELLRQEARAEAEQILHRWAERAFQLTGELPVLYLREGNRRDELFAQIAEDAAISILVLGASTGKGGPGPLITEITGKYLGKLKIPMTIVPDSLSDEEISLVS